LVPIPDVQRMVFRDGLTVISVGIVLGMIASFTLAHSVSALFQVSPHDAPVFTTAPILLCATALLGIVIPCQRPMRVNPIEALRSEQRVARQRSTQLRRSSDSRVFLPVAATTRPAILVRKEMSRGWRLALRGDKV
jgi:hypothetical protein